MEEKKLIIDVSLIALLKVTLFMLGIWLVFELHTIFILIFVSIILAASLSPFVYRMKTRGVPVAITVILSYAVILSLVSLAIAYLAGPFINQTIELIKTIPELISRLTEAFPLLNEYLGRFNWADISLQVSEYLLSMSSDILQGISGAISLLFSVIGGMIGSVMVLVLSYYIIADKENLQSWIMELFPKRKRKEVSKVLVSIDKNLGLWVRGQLLLVLIIGIFSYIGLVLFGVQYALPLAVLAGLLEALPTIGPIITTVVVFLLALGTGEPWFVVFGVTLWFVLQQQLENYVIVPKVMNKAVGLNPIVTIVAILAGAELLGVAGALLAVPTMAVVSIILRNYLELRDGNNKSE